MTRTLHTQPRAILASRRSAAPHRSRGDEPLVALRERRLIGDLGIELPDDADGGWPRIRVGRCRPGFLHPIGRHEIVELLTFLGPLTCYGLHSIELRQADPDQHGGLALARLVVPGRILLYEQPQPPWLVRGDFAQGSRERLEHSGAIVESGLASTRVDWPGDALAQLMLFDGLMHEIGHHLIQHHRGKRLARVMRTADHERRATRFAEACRRAWLERLAPR